MSRSRLQSLISNIDHMTCSLSSKNSPRNTVDFEAACLVYIRFRGVNGYLGSEKGIEGKYVIATSELGLSVLEVVAIYKDLSDVERGFRQLKDVLAMRPIYHQI